jgi:hypothetical protein
VLDNREKAAALRRVVVLGPHAVGSVVAIDHSLQSVVLTAQSPHRPLVLPSAHIHRRLFALIPARALFLNYQFRLQA